MKRGKTLFSLLLALLLLISQPPLRAAAADASLLDDGQEHVHSLVKVEAAQPTMSATGCLEHYRCEGCGRLFWDPDAQQETDLDSVNLPTLSSGIVRVDESGIEIGDDWTVSVPVYLNNQTGAAFSGQVLVVVYEDERFLGVDVWQIELAPGEARQRRMELQVRPKYGNSNLLKLRYFVISGDFSPMATPEAVELPRNPETDQAIYDRALGRYAALLRAAEAVSDVDERYVRMAMAEAELLDSAVVIPTTTQGGAYTISRIAPRTTPYVQWGNDDDRWFGMVVSADDFLTVAERQVFFDAWNAAVAGEGEYDPVAIMESLGHGVRTDFKTTFSTAPVTLDWLNTSAQADTAVTVQTVAGLVQYDNLNRMQPMLAESWNVSADGRTYTFHIRPGVYWYTSAGEPCAELTANDFVCGFRHMLDCSAGLEWLVEGIVRGASDYLYWGGSFEDVGYAAPDKYTLVVTLEQPTSYFLSMLTYSCFLPICDSFYQSRGGVYGIWELEEARSGNRPVAYTFGQSWDVSSQVYCGPFLLQKLDAQEEILVVRNESFFANDKTVLDSIRWVNDAGESPAATFDKVLRGEFASMGLSEAAGTLALAKECGLFDDYAYVSETTSTTYFGALNLNRGTFALDNGAAASPKSTKQKADTQTAMQSKAFRQALQFAFDKGAQNATSRGEELKYTNLRNMYTHPQFVNLSRAVTLDGKTFPAGTFYGEIVQYYLEQLGSPVLVDDQIDGWYHPETARARLAQARAELGDSVSWPITIDVVYYSLSGANSAQAQAYKESIESTLGAENVTVNLVPAETSADYYASGYRASNGKAGNFDMFYGSGWGPDYGDPSTYLDTFLDLGQGYMTKTIGLDLAPEPEEPYARESDEAVYEAALGRYQALLLEAESVSDMDERYVRMAIAEAELLDSAVMIPTTTQGGAYTISRVAPRTTPYVQWGNDDDRWFGMVVSADDLLTVAERDVFWEAWNAAVAGEGEYDPVAIMESLGHGVRTDYKTTFSTAPSTIDWLSTGAQADTEITVQTVAGLVQYDNLNRMQPMLAESWNVSADGRTYTFHIRPGVYWYTSAGEPCAELTANDFVCGFRHMLDCQAGLEWLVEGVVKGAGEYLYEGGGFENVGYAAPDKYTLVVTLEQPTSYFLSMLTYSCFLPICDSFYQSRGGVYGIEALEEARSGNRPVAYTFGQSWDVSSQVYCGPFLLRKLDVNEEILVVRNESFFANDKTVLDSIRWVNDAGESPAATFDRVLRGEFASMGLTEAAGTLALAKENGLFDTCAYVSETTSTTYFGGLNLNRGTFALDNGAAASRKTERQKADTHAALQSKAFRQALQFAFDKGSYNAVSRGEELKYTNLRNMYTHPQFVNLSRAVTLDGKTFPAGTFYGEIVQYYLEQLGSPVLVDDQIDGWYHPEIARARLAQAKAELGDSVSWPITIDVVYYSLSDANTVQAQAYKRSIQSTLGAENVKVNLVAAETSADYYASGYRAYSGEAGNFDMFYGSGWGPDYGDPSTYLDTFLGYGAGYMTKVIGLF